MPKHMARLNLRPIGVVLLFILPWDGLVLPRTLLLQTIIQIFQMESQNLNALILKGDDTT